jgi:protein SCO1/2
VPPNDRPTEPVPRPAEEPVEQHWFVVGLILVVLACVAFGGLIGLVWVGRSGGFAVVATPSPTPGATPDPATFQYAGTPVAPPLDLTDQDGQPFRLTSLRGSPTLVFFGYTHCPDVCPATVGIIDQALDSVGPGPRAIFVTVDPERDTVDAMKSYLQYLPAAYVGLTGTAAEVRAAADGYGVSYARVETETPGAYSMAHTADVYAVDAQGRLRAHFPFGTEAEPIAAELRLLLAERDAASGTPSASGALAPSAAPTTMATPTSERPAASAAASASGSLRPVVVSTSVWAESSSSIILSLEDASGAPVGGDDAHAWVQLIDPSGRGSTIVEAARVRPPGRTKDMFLATIDIPSPGTWGLAVTASASRQVLRGSTQVTALDPGATPRLGSPAPDVHTPTLDDVGGRAAAVTTDPAPDPRLSRTSTSEARASGTPYVLIVDSWRFRVSSACGRAITTARYMADRWPQVDFIHLEPFRYTLVTEQATLVGDGATPEVTDVAAAWGLGADPWDFASVPWVFVVDGRGTVRLKLHAVFGSDELDVILAEILGQTSG